MNDALSDLVKKASKQELDMEDHLGRTALMWAVSRGQVQSPLDFAERVVNCDVNFSRTFNCMSIIFGKYCRILENIWL